MAYSDPILERQGLEAADIFWKEWRILAYAKSSMTLGWFWPFWWLPAILLNLLWRFRGWRALVVVNKQISAELSWYLHLYFTSLDTFEINYRQAWKDKLDSSRTGAGEVVMLNIFVGSDSMAVPLFFDRSDATKNSDAETFRQLCMWYSWMQYKRGFGEVVLPRRLARVDKVKVSLPVTGTRALAMDIS
jgi:hypothetical protein